MAAIGAAAAVAAWFVIAIAVTIALLGAEITNPVSEQEDWSDY